MVVHGIGGSSLNEVTYVEVVVVSVWPIPSYGIMIHPALAAFSWLKGGL